MTEPTTEPTTEPEDRCPICLEVITNKNIIILKCGHKYDISCYTSFIVHSVKNLVNNIVIDDYKIKCPICRRNDDSMYRPILEEISKAIEDKMDMNMVIEDIEHILYKDFFPHLLTLCDSEYLNKEMLKIVIKRIVKGCKKEIKCYMGDIR